MKYTDYKTLDEFVNAVREHARENTVIVKLSHKLVTKDPSDGSSRYRMSYEFNRGYDIARLSKGYNHILIEKGESVKKWKKEQCESIQKKLEENGIKSKTIDGELLVPGLLINLIFA